MDATFIGKYSSSKDTWLPMVGDPDGPFLDEVDLVGTDVLVNSLSEIDSLNSSVGKPSLRTGSRYMSLAPKGPNLG